MLRLLLAIFSLTVLLTAFKACQSGTHSDETSVISTPMLTYLENQAEVEMDSCRCVVSNSKQAFEQGDHLLSFSYDIPAWMHINGQHQYLERTSASSNIGNDHVRREFENNEYKLRVNMKYQYDVDSTHRWFQGNLQLTSKRDGGMVSQMVMGSCGC